jgi:hypothetical protein
MMKIKPFERAVKKGFSEEVVVELWIKKLMVQGSGEG